MLLLSIALLFGTPEIVTIIAKMISQVGKGALALSGDPAIPQLWSTSYGGGPPGHQPSGGEERDDTGPPGTSTYRPEDGPPVLPPEYRMAIIHLIPGDVQATPAPTD
jgi:hypothetical protein